MHPRLFYLRCYLCVIIVSSLPSILPVIGVLSQDAGCISPDSLLDGRRRIVSAEFRASNARSGNSASQASRDDNGWCSGQLATDIFDPYIEVDFNMDVIFTSVTTEEADSSFIQRYRVQVAGEDGHLQYITPSINTSQPEPAIFPLGQSRISNGNGHTESLPRPVIGQILRINPYQWNDHDHVCTKLEVYGCPLQECQSESQLNSNQYVDDVTVSDSSIDNSYLFNFYDTERYYCGPTNMRPFNMTITYSSPVLLREIGIHGRDRTFRSDEFVNSFSLSFSEDGDNFTEYIRDTGSTEFTVPDHRQHFFGLWPPITASSIKITINDWNDQPCISLLMLGCNYSDVVDHSDDIANGTASGINSGLLDDRAVTLTTTEFVTTTTELLTTTATVTQTSMITVTADSPSPSPTQSNDAAASTSCSSDTDSTPIYVAVAIVIVGLLITIIVVVVGVLLCRRYQKEKKSDGSSSPLNVKYKTTNDANSNKISIVEVDNDLYGKELQPQSQSNSPSPEDNERAQIMLYDNVNAVKEEPDVIETADNPQYGDTLKQSDTTANPKSNENVYSYAVP